MFRSPMLAHSLDEASHYSYPCYASEKLDGVRCVIVDGKLYSRTAHEMKPNVQARFASIAQKAAERGLVLDGELYYEGNDFGELMSTLSADADTLAAKNLRFYCFDAVPVHEWESGETCTKFEARYIAYLDFCDSVDPAHLLIQPVEQYRCLQSFDAQGLFDEVAAKNGEGIMVRSFNAPYRFTRCSEIMKLKRWLSAEAEIVEVHQQACPVKYADEVKDVDGKAQGYKNTCGSVTVKILPDQPLPAGAIQNATFCGCSGVDSVELRRQIWEQRADMLGRVVEFAYLKGGNVGRMARVMRLRPDKEAI